MAALFDFKLSNSCRLKVFNHLPVWSTFPMALDATVSWRLRSPATNWLLSARSLWSLTEPVSNVSWLARPSLATTSPLKSLMFPNPTHLQLPPATWLNPSRLMHKCMTFGSAKSLILTTPHRLPTPMFSLLSFLRRQEMKGAWTWSGFMPSLAMSESSSMSASVMGLNAQEAGGSLVHRKEHRYRRASRYQ
ncbi:uncharacterized protein UDID_18387 [Ustilago sp. UG-2017a]|nr:uncharacterized protein UDID_18387 [Ustilago sp. UG-2017a]